MKGADRFRSVKANDVLTETETEDKTLMGTKKKNEKDVLQR